MNNYKPISCIYKITSPSGKIYIGQTSNLQKRMSRYRTNACKSQKKLFNSLVKYGFNNHKIDVIYICDDHLILNEIEKFFINKFDCFNNGLNLTSGGRLNWVVSEETRDKIKKRSIGNKNRLGHSNKWGKHTDVSRKKMSDIVKERIRINGHHWVGKKQSEDHKNKIAIAKYKPVIKFNMQGEFICEYISLTSAAESVNVSIKSSNISQCCNGKRFTAYGYIWKWK